MRKNLVVSMTTRFFHAYAVLLKNTLWSPINGAKTGVPRCFGVPFRAQINHELNLIKRRRNKEFEFKIVEMLRWLYKQLDLSVLSAERSKK